MFAVVRTATIAAVSPLGMNDSIHLDASSALIHLQKSCLLLNEQAQNWHIR